MTDWRSVVRKMAPLAKPQIAAMIADHAEEQFARWDINTIRRQATILAHAYVETQGFTKLEENLNYTAKRLCQVWPNRFPNIAAATPFANNPQALANKVYNGRMGNRPGTDDGWNNRGKGLWQCTGRANCAEIGKKLNVSPETASAWLIDPAHALECACALFWILKVAPAADAGDVTKQTLRINGGKNGLAERQAAYAKVLRILTAEAATKRAAAITRYGDTADEPEVTAKELRKAGSRTIKGADQAQTGILGAVSSIGGATAVLENTQNIVYQAQSAVDTVQSSASYLTWAHDHWKIIALAILSLLALYFIYRAWRGASLVKLARVDDAITGVNLAR